MNPLPHVSSGFLFSEDMSQVVLVRKDRPPVLHGKLLAAGGKGEPGESPLETVRREFREETSVDIVDWTPVCKYTTEVGHQLHLFMAVGDVRQARTMTSEEVVIADTWHLPPKVHCSTLFGLAFCLDPMFRAGARNITFP